MASKSKKLSKSNTVNKEMNKRRKGAGAVSNKYNKKKSAKPKSASSKTDEFASFDGEYIVPKASENGDDNDSNEEDQDGDTYDLEIAAHLQKSIFYYFRKEIMSQRLNFCE